jgi:hypothetical protein
VEDQGSRRNNSNSSSALGKVIFRDDRDKLDFSNGRVAGNSRAVLARPAFSSVREGSKVDDRSSVDSRDVATLVFSSVRKADNSSVRGVPRRRRNLPGLRWEPTRRGSP